VGLCAVLDIMKDMIQEPEVLETEQAKQNSDRLETIKNQLVPA